MTYRIGFDVGGTKIAGGVFSLDGEKLHHVQASTPTEYNDFIKVCTQLADDLYIKYEKEKRCGGIGFGFPGAVDSSTGTVTAHNIPCLKGRMVRQDLTHALGCPVVMANDANCAALSEANGGAGHGFTNVFVLILGTGVGGGLVTHGKLYQGAQGMGREIGHLPFPRWRPDDGEALACGCGLNGCVETFVSGPGLRRLIRTKMGREMDGFAFAQAIEAGDAEAMATRDYYYDMLARGLSNVLYAFDPDVIVVTGGLSHLPGLCDVVPKLWQNYAGFCVPKTVMRCAQFGAQTGLRGASFLVQSIDD